MDKVTYGHIDPLWEDEFKSFEFTKQPLMEEEIKNWVNRSTVPGEAESLKSPFDTPELNHDSAVRLRRCRSTGTQVDGQFAPVSSLSRSSRRVWVDDDGE